MDNQIQSMDNPSLVLPEKKKFSFRLTWWLKILIFSLLALIVVSLVLALALKTQVNNKRSLSVTPTPTLAEQDVNSDDALNPLRQELDSISNDLSKIDPLKADLAMPPVQLELDLDSDMF